MTLDRPLRSLPAIFLLVMLGLSSPAHPQVKVNIDLGKDLNILTSATLGAPVISYDGSGADASAVPYLHSAGVTLDRYPGNPPVADLFHWSTSSFAPWKGAEAPYLAPGNSFPNFAATAAKLGTALIVVNYGSNAGATAAADPAEAAAWVAYANGDPADTRPLGKSPAETPWHTIGYWATLRSEAPLPTDDGFNALRIQHPRPLGIALWQVGDQVYNNGFYGGEHTGEPDLHAPAPASSKDFARLRKHPSLSPAYYGARLVEFSRAMKAVDPAIRIGAALTTPPGNAKWAPDWNPEVLKAACKDIDFVTLAWSAGGVLPPDYKTLDESELLSSTRAQLGEILNGVLYDYRKNCPADHFPRIAFAPAGIIPWPKVERPVVAALWVADTYALLAESGTINATWTEMHGDSFLSPDNQRSGPAFYGLQMLHIVARSAGDSFVAATSSSPAVAVHATRRRDGVTGILLVNRDPQNPATIHVAVTGAAVGAKGRRFDYGITQQKVAAAPAASELSGLGPAFDITVPPYTITDVLIPKAQ